MNIGVVGGDLRIVELIKILHNNKNKIFVYGLENAVQLYDCNKNKKTSSSVEFVENLYEIEENCDIIITSIPISKDGKTLNTPFSQKNILIEEIFETIQNKEIITGNITTEIASRTHIDKTHNKIVDVLADEELKILNAIPTSEGAIQIAMEESQITIHNSNCLVMGFGRIGKILSKQLYGMGAKVSCEARRKEDLASIELYGYEPVALKEMDKFLDKYDFIFNTIPCIILDRNNLKLIKKDCMLIDLASKPGGIDFDEAKKLGLKTKWALALPGKVASKTAAEYIYKVLGL